MKHAAKLMKETDTAYLVGGYGVVWGGRDLSGEFFESDCDFWFDRLTETPMVLYHHGQAGTTGKAVLGAVVTKTADDTGLWIEAELEKASEYAEQVLALVKKGVLGWSSGAVAHLTEIARGGKIVSWPVAEFSLTPTPCEPRTLGVSELDGLAASDVTIKALVDKVKALPAGAVPMDGEDGDPPEGSYEDLIADLSRLVRMALCDPADWESYAYIVATFPEYAIACVYDDGPTFYRVGYVIGSDMEPVLTGAPEPMARAYVPVESADIESTAMMADDTVRSLRSFSHRLRGLHEGRVKEGRVLSSANRKRLATARDAMNALLKDFEDLLAATEPKQADEAGTAKALLDVQIASLRARALAIEIGVPA